MHFSRESPVSALGTRGTAVTVSFSEGFDLLRFFFFGVLTSKEREKKSYDGTVVHSYYNVCDKRNNLAMRMLHNIRITDQNYHMLFNK